MIVFISGLLKFVNTRLSAKEKLILGRARNFTGSATALVRLISESENIPLSTVWHNLRCLREAGLIEFNKGAQLRLTVIGKVLAGGDGNEKDQR